MKLENMLFGGILGATTTGYIFDLYNTLPYNNVNMFTGLETEYVNSTGAFIASTTLALGMYTGHKIKEYINEKINN